MSVGAVQMLQKSLADAQKDLSSTNETIKKITGRDPDVPPSRSGPERRSSAGGRMRAWSGDYESPAAKRRDPYGGRARLAGRMGPLAGRLGPPPGRLGPPPGRRVSEGHSERRRDSDGEESSEKGTGKVVLQSSVVATTAPPRPNDDPAQDEQSKKRNRRMFGFLMGTLQKFKQNEETAKHSDKERRRTEIVEKLTRMEELEKEAAVTERKGLYDQRRSQRTKVARLARQMTTVEMYTEWNDHDQLLCKFIRTKAKPPIFYLPAQHTPETEKLLQSSKESIEEEIATRNKEIETFLSEDQNEDNASQQEPVETGGGGEGAEEGSGLAGTGESMEIKADPELERGGMRSGSDSGELSESD